MSRTSLARVASFIAPRTLARVVDDALGRAAELLTERNTIDAEPRSRVAR